MQAYDHRTIEAKWQQRWEEEGFGRALDAPTTPGPSSGRRGLSKAYVLVEFPYPSGEGLHVGHVRSYTALDAVSRKLRMQGKNVLFPIGWDAFGLPTENYALKTGVHPRVATDRNIANFRKQMKALGLSFDWSREVDTTDPKYYRWTQWIFLQLFKHGLAYQATIPISWCPKDKIGLANEEVVGGKCERCGTAVERRMQKQWMLKITAYADRLLKDLDTVDYSERIKTQQQNWIGRSEGAEVRFEIEDQSKEKLALLIHGCPKESGYPDPIQRHWFPWLRAELLKLNYSIVQPEMPNAHAPSYEQWKKALEEKLGNRKVGVTTIAIGHSCGSSFLVRYLSETNQKIGGLACIAPAKGASSDRLKDNIKALELFYNYKPQKDIASRVLVLYSTKDKLRHVEAARFLSSFYKAETVEFPERGHFTESDGVTEIPELLDWVNRRSSINVFTTRPDTLFGATYLVLSPEHPLVDKITTAKQKKAVEKYKKQVANKSDLERTSLEKEKTGVFIGAFAVNPVNNEKIPVWIADYVLMSYGTGAIMAVPAHDERDFAFATKSKLPIRQVIAPLYTNTTDLPIRKDKSIVRRPVVYAIIRNPKDDTYLCLKWKERGWGSFVVGGYEAGEDPVAAAIRETKEETGYTDLRHVATVDWQVHSQFFAEHKQENRYGIASGIVFELKSAKKEPVSVEEKNRHEPVWVSADKVRDFVTHKNAKFVWDCYRTPSAYVGEGVMVNSGKFDGITSEEGRNKIVEWLAKTGMANKPACLLVHGISGHKRENWFPWFKKEMDAKGWNTIIPTMPGAGHPTAESWDDFLKQFDEVLDSDSVLVGHSLDCAAVLRHLQTLNRTVGTVILVAPTNPLQHWDALKHDIPDIDWNAVQLMNNEKDVDWNKIRKLAKRFIVLYSDNDPYIPEKSISFFRKHLPDAEYHRIPGRFHFSESSGVRDLPEILEFIPAIEQSGSKARFAVNFKLRDWVFSRQHYWGEPIPVVHCEKCKKDAESTKWKLNFYEGPWQQLQNGQKTVETRALNPEEKSRYFGNLKVGDIIKGTLKGTDQTMYLRVTEQKICKDLTELLQHPEWLKEIGNRGKQWTLKELEDFYRYTPDYLDRIKENGLVLWKVEHILPGVVTIPDQDLPVALPQVEQYQPSGTGESPLAGIDEWVNVKCPKCGGPAKRETDTMPNWAGSSWYFLRYCDPHNDQAFADKKKLEYWMPVDLYNGGMEHTTLHLLYSRFWHKFLFDKGFVPTAEPYQRRVSHGMVLASDGRKMSKSFGNVINPDDIVQEYGADSLRLYEMFMGPFEDAIPWDMKGIVGMQRFLQRVWDMCERITKNGDAPRRVHAYIASITVGLDEMRFNTCISDLMKWSNEWKNGLGRPEWENFLIILSPFAPHLAEELWSQLGHTTMVSNEPWPTFDPKLVQQETATIAVQVNGKLRGTLIVPSGSEQEIVASKAMELDNVKKFVPGTPKKVIFVKDRLINFVV